MSIETIQREVDSYIARKCEKYDEFKDTVSILQNLPFVVDLRKENEKLQNRVIDLQETLYNVRQMLDVDSFGTTARKRGREETDISSSYSFSKRRFSPEMHKIKEENSTSPPIVKNTFDVEFVKVDDADANAAVEVVDDASADAIAEEEFVHAGADAEEVESAANAEEVESDVNAEEEEVVDDAGANAEEVESDANAEEEEEVVDDAGANAEEAESDANAEEAESDANGEESVTEMEIDGKMYYVTDEKNGKIYKMLENEECGDEVIGVIQNGQPSFFHKKVVVAVKKK